MNYWEECVSEALDDANITATRKQIEIVASWIEGAHENYGMATGQDCIPNPIETQAEQRLRALEREKKEQEDWVNSTKPCKSCTTTGWTFDGWGRDVICYDCNGKGRS